MEEENNKRTGITAKIDEIFAEGEKMHNATGTKPPTQQLKEAAIIGGLVVGSLSGLTVGDAAYRYGKNNGPSDPNKATEAVLPESPPHTAKTPQQLIEEYKDKGNLDKGHAEKIEDEKKSPTSKARE